MSDAHGWDDEHEAAGECKALNSEGYLEYEYSRGSEYLDSCIQNLLWILGLLYGTAVKNAVETQLNTALNGEDRRKRLGVLMQLWEDSDNSNGYIDILKFCDIDLGYLLSFLPIDTDNLFLEWENGASIDEDVDRLVHHVTNLYGRDQGRDFAILLRKVEAHLLDLSDAVKAILRSQYGDPGCWGWVAKKYF